MLFLAPEDGLRYGTKLFLACRWILLTQFTKKINEVNYNSTNFENVEFLNNLVTGRSLLIS